MTYHTNHSFCRKSCWEDKSFNAEVMVYFEKYLDTDYLREIDEDYSIADPDYEILTNFKEVFDKASYDIRKEFQIEKAKEKGIPFDLEKFDEFYKEFEYKEKAFLKPKIIEWLNKNVKDYKGTDNNSDIVDRKSWAVGAEDYDINNQNIMIFFKRQEDALAFIEKWSIFKEPTFYFDYFHDDRREQDINKTMKIVNDFRKELNKESYILKSKKPQTQNINLDKTTFHFIDWENEVEEELENDDFLDM
jgi:hypothetical protein